jgi:hypothetical protein
MVNQRTLFGQSGWLYRSTGSEQWAIEPKGHGRVSGKLSSARDEGGLGFLSTCAKAIKFYTSYMLKKFVYLITNFIISTYCHFIKPHYYNL